MTDKQKSARPAGFPDAPPPLGTERYVLRALSHDDADDIDRWLSDPSVSRNLSHVPHPYGAGMAHGWVSLQAGFLHRGEGIHYAIADRLSGELAGSIGVSRRDAVGRDWEFGYWVAPPIHNRGCATECGRGLVAFMADRFPGVRLHAGHFLDNPASGRVLEKIGFAAVSDAPVDQFSLARGEKAKSLRYVWPPEAASSAPLTPLQYDRTTAP